ncbi:hypothetical protein MSPP1_002438 [Malassezia sp. CBS 17886]|nr:hypothetical protein MSPP1_002438 [Malassezia sp. CBS 17886]
MSIFRKAQTAVAHNSSFPSLGNNELKELQDLIHAEKQFVGANAKAASEADKCSEMLRQWGSSEGDDFQDVLPKVALLYDHYSRAQIRYNYFVSTMRLHLKSVRTREEAYAELRSRKRNLASKIESVERKLARMGPENKDLAKVTSNLREMRSDMEVLRHELLNEDAALGDFKRRTLVEALNLKSGGLMELAEKSIVVSETTRLLAEELPLGSTAPGQPRAAYRSEARTDRLLQEAVRQLEAIQFQPREDIAMPAEYGSPTSPTTHRVGGSFSKLGVTAAGLSGRLDAARGGPPTSHGRSAYDAGADDVSQGSQGWYAPGHGPTGVVPAHADVEGGLPTVQETSDDPLAGPYAPPEHAEAEAADYAHGDTQAEYDARFAAGLGDPLHEAPQYAGGVPSEYPDYGGGAQPQYPCGYEVGVGYPHAEVPSFPPIEPPAPQPEQYVSVTPHSRDSPLEDGREENRAYFEGVGGTKALQAAAAARNSGFPLINYANINQTPGMFATDAESGKNFSPSELFHMDSASPPERSSSYAPERPYSYVSPPAPDVGGSGYVSPPAPDVGGMPYAEATDTAIPYHYPAPPLGSAPPVRPVPPLAHPAYGGPPPVGPPPAYLREAVSDYDPSAYAEIAPRADAAADRRASVPGYESYAGARPDTVGEPAPPVQGAPPSSASLPPPVQMGAYMPYVNDAQGA